MCQGVSYNTLGWVQGFLKGKGSEEPRAPSKPTEVDLLPSPEKLDPEGSGKCKLYKQRYKQDTVRFAQP